MFLLGAHFIGLLVELLDFDLFGANVTLELLNLVVKHELELFQLLNLLLQLAYLDVFLFDGGDTSTILLFRGFDVDTDLLLLNHFVFELIFLLL